MMLVCSSGISKDQVCSYEYTGGVPAKAVLGM